ncbi:MAG TPA: response regulator [Phycisphaerae bacterium]|nr:response regulator [Phycisphaerae bacterium]
MITETSARPAVILLVEDDPGDQELTRRALKESKICNELCLVEDGEEAMDYLFRRGRFEAPSDSPRPDLILLDLNLPRVDGREVMKQLSADPDLRIIPVVVLTTSKQEEDIIRSYELGCNSFITKPVDLNQFIEVVKHLEEYWFELVVLPPRRN